MPDPRSSVLLVDAEWEGGAHSLGSGGLSRVRSGKTPPGTAVCGGRYTGQVPVERVPHAVYNVR